MMGLLCQFCTQAQDWLWTRGNTGGGMDGWCVATDPSGNVFVGGVAWGSADAAFGGIAVPYSVSSGGYQCIVAKYDAQGHAIWAKGTQHGACYMMNIAADQSGNVIVFGSFTSATMQIGSFTLTNTVAPEAQFFLVKFDPSGNVLWAKNAGNAQNGVATLGGIALAFGTGAITCDAADNIYITTNFRLPVITIGGITLTNNTTVGSKRDILLAKYDPSGSPVWAKSFGGAENDEAYGITVNSSGDIYIAGVFGSPTLTFGPSILSNGTPNQLAFIARFDNSGTPTWACSSGGSGGEYAIGLAVDRNDNVYMTGGMQDHSISFSGTAISKSTQNPALYLIKFDPANNVSWYKLITSADSAGAWGYSIAMSQCGIVWVSGVMKDSVNIDGNILRSPPNSLDPIFIAGYTAGGSYIGSASLQSGGDDQNGIACDRYGNLYMCSDYQAQLPFIVNKDTLPPDNTAGEYLFVAKHPYINSSLHDYTTRQATLCLNGSMALQGPGGYNYYLWNDGQSGMSKSVSESGTFWVCSYDSCTAAEIDTFSVIDCDCAKALFVPNAFTPNGDGQDDVFYPRSGRGIERIISFRIYNRWGNLLFEKESISPNDISNAWNGSYNGEKALPDVYVWAVDALCENGKTITKKGSVTIIR